MGMKHAPPNQKLSRKEVGSIIGDRDPENKPGELGESNDAEERGESPDVERMEIEGCENGATCNTHMKQPPTKPGKSGEATPFPYQQPSKKVFQSHDDFMAHVHQHTKGMFKGGK